MGATEAKCFKEQVVKYVIFYFSLMLRGQITTALKTARFSNKSVIGDFDACSFSGILETKKQIEMHVEGSGKVDKEMETVRCGQHLQKFIFEEELRK